MIQKSSDEPKLLIFGGKDSNGAYLGDAYVLNVDTNSWSKVVPSAASLGKAPLTCKPRAYHTAVRIGSIVYIFGGAEEGGVPSNDTWTFNAGTILLILPPPSLADPLVSDTRYFHMDEADCYGRATAWPILSRRAGGW